jgi:hypothetical protein
MRQRAVRTIAMAAGRAAEVKAELLDCPDNMVRDRSSTFVLGVAGIAPATTPGIALNIEIKAGYVIDLTDDRPGADAGMRIISSAVRPRCHRPRPAGRHHPAALTAQARL